MANKKNTEKVFFNIQVQKSLKDTFIKVCEANDTTASQEIRKLMRIYINKNKQGSLV
jgi:hypothetical protein